MGKNKWEVVQMYGDFSWEDGKWVCKEFLQAVCCSHYIICLAFVLFLGRGGGGGGGGVILLAAMAIVTLQPRG